MTGREDARPTRFLSDVSEDRDAARILRRSLEEDGCRVCMAPDDVRGPAPRPEQIADAIAACDVLDWRDGPRR